MNILLINVVVFALGGTSLAKSLEESRIFLGAKVSAHEKPFQVLLRASKHSKEVCSGILVTDNWVLTSDLCNVQEDTKLYFGTDKWCVEKDGVGDFKNDKTRQIRSVKRVVHHPDADDFEVGHSFDLVELKKPVNLTEYVQLAKLATKLPEDKEVFEVSGWGLTSNIRRSTASCDLLKGSAPKLTNDTCYAFWNGEEDGYRPKGFEFCAGYMGSRGPSPCGMDWGSPLVKDGEVYGLVVRVHSKCESSASIYLPVKPYLDWIRQTTDPK